VGAFVGAAAYAISTRRLAALAPLTKQEVPNGSIPVLIISDIGADIDDTFAMM
jgi:hypothetical protein